MMNQILRKSFVFAGLCCAFALLTPSVAIIHAQESAEESLKTLHPAEGVEVSLWANEPMVNNPTSMEIDSRGRVWIAEGLNYRMKMKEFDDLKRVDGADRIKILEDSNGDGKADKVTVFAENIFPVPLGLAIEEIWIEGKQTGTRIYVGNSPDLLVLEDTDGDDKVDRRFALLTGFRGVDSDHGLHGMTFGPDGKLYFTVGDARYGADKVQAREPTFDVTDKSGRRLTSSNFGTTLRVNRDGTGLEVLSSGHRNNYEAAVDSFGNVFGSDNDDDGNRGCRMYWVMDGGKYGYQHPESSRHWAEEVPGIIPKLVGTGNGAPGGLTVYEGEMLPANYRGAVLQVESGTRQVNSHRLVRHGAGFRSDYEVLLKGNDAWFRPVDVSVAPDGSVFVCDWYDAGVGGNRFSDQSTGRIYRLSGAGAKEAKATLEGDGALAALKSPNATTRLAAFDSLVAKGGESRSGLLELFQRGQPTQRARALNALFALPDTGTSDAIAVLANTDPRIRETALKLLARDAARESVVSPDSARNAEPPATRVLDHILPLVDDDDAGVRRALLMALRNVPTSKVGETLTKLARSWDGRDRYYLEAIRAATVHRESDFVSRIFTELADEALKSNWDSEPVARPPFYPTGTNDAFLRPSDGLAAANGASRNIGIAWALQRSEALPALKKILNRNHSASVEQAAIIAVSGISDPAAGKLLVRRYFADGIDDRSKQSILRSLGTGLADNWKAIRETESLNQMIQEALNNDALKTDAIETITRGALQSFADNLIEVARDETASVPVRSAAMTALGKLKHAEAGDLANALIASAKNARSGGPLVQSALDTLHSLAGVEELTPLIADSGLPLDVRRRSLQLVAGSAPGADSVMALRKQNSFPEDLEDELSFLLHNHSDRRVRRMAEKELPIRQSDVKKRLHSVQAVLSVQGNADRGKELFLNHKDAACARCHRTDGQGTLVGPDLASIGMKYGAKELLYHIQYPSGAINYNFAAHTFLLADGRVVNGLVLDRKDDKVTLGLATGQKTTIEADDIEEELPQTVSLMPKGLVAGFSAQQLSDLIEYLLTLRQGDVGQEHTK